MLDLRGYLLVGLIATLEATLEWNERKRINGSPNRKCEPVKLLIINEIGKTGVLFLFLASRTGFQKWYLYLFLSLGTY